MDSGKLSHLADSLPLRPLVQLTGVVFLLWLGACAPYQYEAKPLDPELTARAYLARDLATPALRDFLTDNGAPPATWPQREWDLHSLTLAAWHFHPELDVALAAYQKARVHEQTVNARINPGVHLPLEHHSDTIGGQSPWLIGILLELVFEREAKRLARRAQAQSETRAAGIHMDETAWNIYSRLRQSAMDYYAAGMQAGQLEDQIRIAAEVLHLLERRKELGRAGAFELSTAQIDLQRLRLLQAGQQYVLVEARHALAGALGLPAAALDGVQLEFSGFASLDDMTAMPEAELRKLALTQRADIRRALAAYDIQEATLRLEIEKQYPDVILSPGFVFDQNDLIWALGSSWVLPLLQPQNEGAIRESLAQRAIGQAEFLALQARVINEQDAARARLAAQGAALAEAEKLLAETEVRSGQLAKQYELGYADQLEVIRGRFEAAVAQQAVAALRIALLKAAGQLEDAIQYPVFIKAAYRQPEPELPDQ